MKNRKEGIALVFTLGFVLALIILTLEFHRRCQQHLVSLRHQLDKIQAEFLARSGGAVAVEILKADKNNYDWLGEEWNRERVFQTRAGEIKLMFQDENGKINLNGILQSEGKVNTKLKELTERLFLVLGLSHDLLDCLLDWIDEDEMPRVFGAESNYYQNLEHPYHCSNRSLLSLKELSLVKGFTAEVLKGNQETTGLLDLVTLTSDSKININTCAPPIIKALGFSEMELNEILAQRESCPLEDAYLMKVNREVFLANRSLISYRSSCFSVVVEVKTTTGFTLKRRFFLTRGEEVSIRSVEAL